MTSITSNKDNASKISTKLFAGCSINSEMRMHLNQSIQWKHATLLSPSNRDLQEVHSQGKDFFGHYLESNKLTINELKTIQQYIITQLKIYCPTLETENIKICLFHQVFIA